MLDDMGYTETAEIETQGRTPEDVARKIQKVLEIFDYNIDLIINNSGNQVQQMPIIPDSCLYITNISTREVLESKILEHCA